jgi:hypothetical protein
MAKQFKNRINANKQLEIAFITCVPISPVDRTSAFYGLERIISGSWQRRYAKFARFQ